MERLKDKVAIVTGSGRGIGRGEALALASEGARIVVNDVGSDSSGRGFDPGPADRVVDEIRNAGGEAVANYDSVAVPEGGEAIIQAAIDAFGRLDILVNNAGILRDRMVFNMSTEEFDEVIKVHLYGHFHTTRPACTIFREQRSGRIINTSSLAGLLGFTFGQANYGAAKEGIVGLTRQVACDMGRYGVTCNAIRPNAGTRMTLNDEIKEAFTKAGHPETIEILERLNPDDIAALVVWLASDDAAHVNGRVFLSETGRIALYSEPVEQKALVKDGGFTIDELFASMPHTLARDIVNPSPPKKT